MKLMLQAEQLIKEHKVKFIDLRFSDTVGVQHHVTLSVKQLTEEVLTVGQPFDGSSIAGWKGIESSDMLLLPDLTTATIDQFYQDSTLAIVCDVIDPLTMQAYSCCPRGIAKKAEQWLQSLGFANQAYFGPEAEFFIFEAVTWENSIASSSYKIESTEGSWNSNTVLAGGNIGHRPSIKGGYLAMTPADSLHDIRSAMCLNLEKAGIQTELHHHEVATAGQCEIGTKYSSLVQRADWSQLFKHIVKNTAHLYGKTATFMPKPIAGDNGSGMHVHQSLWLNDVNLFAGNDYAQLSPLALYYIGGIIKHARAINALTNPTTNSYKRLVPGFEAPVMLTYSARNRSAAIRVPFANSSNRRADRRRSPSPARWRGRRCGRG